MSVQYLIGDVFDRMAQLEDGSVDLVLTSPPFLALRSYLPADHPDKDKEIGSEKTPAEFIDVLLRLTAEWRRLLTPHGTICVELGDTYSGSGGAGGDYNEDGFREGQARFSGSATKRFTHDVGDDYRPSRSGRGDSWPLAKSLTLVPEAYRFALAYGVNPHTGQPSPAGTWRIRNVIRWVRPNPPVGALGDKFRPATSELVVACVSKDRWFDLDAVREPLQHDYRPEAGRLDDGKRNEKSDGGWSTLGNWNPTESSGAPPLDWWNISPKGYAGAHYAVWPSELCVKPIQAMCPRQVCRECGQPRRRIIGEVSYPESVKDGAQADNVFMRGGRSVAGTTSHSNAGLTRQAETLGWSDCGHDNFRPGLVLDPFAGTGTTLMVAHGHGRDAIGIDIDPRNADLAVDRVGSMFLEVSNA